jgi:hypothetical protein
MKVLIVLAAAALVSCVSAGHLGGYASGYEAAPAAVSTGSSSQFREEDSYGNYKFGYDEAHSSGRSGRREERNGDIVTGSYSLADADGRDRTVHYVADASGFRATIHTNEPGVDASRDPAAVLINKQGFAAVPAPEQVAVAVAPAFRPAAPVAYGPAAAAIRAPLPAPLPAAPVFAAKGYAAPAPVYAPEPAPAAYESNQRQAFSYSFGTTHPSFAAAPTYIAAPAPAPVLAQAPIYQHSVKY